MGKFFDCPGCTTSNTAIVQGPDDNFTVIAASVGRFKREIPGGEDDELLIIPYNKLDDPNSIPPHIEHLVITAHGAPNTTAWGQKFDQHDPQSWSETLTGAQLGEKVREAGFQGGKDIFLFTCNGGTPDPNGNSTAQALANATGLPVTAAAADKPYIDSVNTHEPVFTKITPEYEPSRFDTGKVVATKSWLGKYSPAGVFDPNNAAKHEGNYLANQAGVIECVGSALDLDCRVPYGKMDTFEPEPKKE